MFTNNNHGLPGRYHVPSPVETITMRVGVEDLELWVPPPTSKSHYKVPDIRPFLVGPDWSCEGYETWDNPEPEEMLYELARECGMISCCEEGTPIQKEIRALNDLRKETDYKIQKGIADKEWFGVDGAKECRLNLQIYEDALDQWREEAEVQSCLGSARFVDYDQGTGETFYVRNSDNKVSTLTAEQLDQRVQLNIRFNLGFEEVSWENNNQQYFEEIGSKHDWRQGQGGVIEGKQVGLEIVSSGEKFSVAKWDCGGVFIPKGASDYLRDLTEEGWNSPGKKFLGNIVWTNGKYPWRLYINGVVGRIDGDVCW
jgi:hypothetical protein